MTSIGCSAGVEVSGAIGSGAATCFRSDFSLETPGSGTSEAWSLLRRCTRIHSAMVPSGFSLTAGTSAFTAAFASMMP